MSNHIGPFNPLGFFFTQECKAIRQKLAARGRKAGGAL